LTVLLVGVVPGALALLARANLFPLMSGDSDEPVYVYQARMLAQGHITLASRVHAEFFHPWLFGQRGGHLFSQYEPGWPAVIAVGHALGDERLALVLAAVAAVAATWCLAEQVAPRSGLFAAGLLVISPIFVVQAGLYLSYLWTTALVAGALAAVVAGVRTRRNAPFCVSGVLFGALLFTRPFDAFMVAAVASVYATVALWADRRALLRAGLWTGLCGAPFLVLTLAYNAYVTGSPARFPLQAAERLDTFGFGLRRMAPDQGRLDYTPHLAYNAMWRSVGSLSYWFAGAGIGLLLVVGAIVVHRRRRETWLLVAMVAVFPAGYFFWWATSLGTVGGASGLGPLYYIPVFAALSVLGGWALRDIANRSHRLAALGVVVVVAGSLVMAPTVVRNAHIATDLNRAKATPLTAASLEDAVVVMRADPSRYMFLDFPFLVGDPRLRGRVLYATDRGAASAALAARFPDRKLYQFVQRTEPGHPLLKPSYIVEPMHVVRGPTVDLGFETTNPAGQPFVVASLYVDGHRVSTQVVDRASHSGAVLPIDVALAADRSDLPAPRPGLLAAAVEHDGQVEVRVAFGPGPGPEHSDIYARRYDVARDGSDLLVQTPGLQYHRYDFGSVVWVRENVNARLRERS
jgi:hypothetical protein